jgi:S-adenosylmethionine hydrolase
VPRGLVTLTTDFGLSDHYVGVMKGVILRCHPGARIVDLCHLVEPYDLTGACLTLAASYSYFPPGTVHVVVVDPGVGGPRRAILAEAGEWLFLAPDNGVLELVYRRHAARVRELRHEQFALEPLSHTFHGRDVFAPAAGLLAKGTPAEELGDPIQDFVRLPLPGPRPIAGQGIEGIVLKVDRFGNLITNLQPGDLPPAFVLTVGEAKVRTLRPAYEDAAPGEMFTIIGSSGYVEISINQGSAADAAQAGAGSVVEVVSGGVVE